MMQSEMTKHALLVCYLFISNYPSVGISFEEAYNNIAESRLATLGAADDPHQRARQRSEADSS